MGYMLRKTSVCKNVNYETMNGLWEPAPIRNSEIVSAQQNTLKFARITKSDTPFSEERGLFTQLSVNGRIQRDD